MKTWYNPLTWFEPSVKLIAKPLVLNPTKVRTHVRAIMRLERVRAAIAKGDKRPELVKEANQLYHLIESVK